MTDEKKTILALDAIARGGSGRFIVERVHEVGTPSVWYERIGYELGHAQSLVKLRSVADEGGEPIGSWVTAADPAAAPELAKAMLTCGFVGAASDMLLPGQGYVLWRLVTEHGLVTALAADDSPTRDRMAPLEGALRRVANAVKAGRRGAELTCELTVADDGASATVTLANYGTLDGLLSNPLVDRSGSGYLRIEAGKAPEYGDVPYEPLPPPEPQLPDAWRWRWLPFPAGARLVVPLTFPLPPSARGKLVRAVYSSYADLDRVGSVPAVRGRAFSRPVELP